jgi:hypothetical protein
MLSLLLNMKRNRLKDAQLNNISEALREFWPLLVLIARFFLEAILLVKMIMKCIENT